MLAVCACGGPTTSDPVGFVADAGGARPDSGTVGNDDGGSTDGGAPLPDAGASDAGVPDAGVPDTGIPDSGVADAGSTGPVDAGSWRTSLANCWTDATCPRLLSVAHGGAWTSSLPYDSNGALAAAYALGLDGVKIDVRVTADNVPVVAHSSPIELFESLDCYGKSIESMTAAQVTACHRVPSTSEKFQRLDEVLQYLRGKLVVQLCVKKPADFGRTIAEIHSQGAEDFAFIEVNTSDLPAIPSLPGAATVWYLVNVGGNLAEVDTVIAMNFSRAFMVEFDPSVSLGNVVATKLHPAGKRSFTYDNAASPTVAQLRARFDQGFEAVSAQSAANLVQARQQANQARAVSPP